MSHAFEVGLLKLQLLEVTSVWLKPEDTASRSAFEAKAVVFRAGKFCTTRLTVRALFWPLATVRLGATCPPGEHQQWACRCKVFE